MTTGTLTGPDAIRYAEHNGLTLSKYADPIEDARDGLSVEEAREIAKEDPSLIWIETVTYLAVGTDGRDPVVWGAGNSEEEALADADREAEGEDWRSGGYDVVLAPEWIAARVRGGENDCDALGIDVKVLDGQITRATVRWTLARLTQAAVEHGETAGAEDYLGRAEDVGQGAQPADWAWPYSAADEAYVNAVGSLQICEEAGIPEWTWDVVRDAWFAAFRRGYEAQRAGADECADCGGSTAPGTPGPHVCEAS